jgi:hypothetical protein
MVQGKFFGSFHLVAPVATKSCGIFLAFRYFWIALFEGALDQLADLLHGLRRRIAVVIGDEVDLAAVDAALVVDHLEIGFFGLADDAIGRRRTAVRHDVADLDLGIGRAGVVFLLSECCAGAEGRDRRYECGGSQYSSKKQFSLLP